MATTDTGTANYRGELFLIGANQTPFLNMMGGLGRGKRSTSFTFPLAQPWSLASASQDTQSETVAATAGTPTTTSRAQDTNVCQIMKPDVEVTFKKQSTTGTISGINTEHGQPVMDELGFQKMAQLRQLAINVEHSFFQGTYVAESAAATNQKTRGLIEACTTNEVVAAGATLDKDLIDALVKKMADTGSLFQMPVIFVNSWQKQKLTNAYGYAPEDRNYGGLNIKTIETDFGIMGVVFAPKMATDSLLIAEMSVCDPVFVPINFDGEQLKYSAAGGDVIWVPTAVTAAKTGGFYYTQIGLDYGPEEYHGLISGLATS